MPRPETRTALEERIGAVGQRLAESIDAVLEVVPGSPHRPQALAKTLGIATRANAHRG